MIKKMEREFCMIILVFIRETGNWAKKAVLGYKSIMILIISDSFIRVIKLVLEFIKKTLKFIKGSGRMILNME